jgi:hypothetical protein
MKPQDNAKVIEVLEKQTLHNYIEKLVNTRMRKLTLFPVFPYTAAANISEPQHYIIIEDLSGLAALDGSNYRN